MSAGHAHDGRQFETLYESLDPDNVLESAILDKGYDADRIRERLSYDGIQPVIPPISTRSKKLHYNKELYRNRNLIERFFNKIKHFRRIATYCDAQNLPCRSLLGRGFYHNQELVNTT